MIAQALEAEILRLYHAEHWPVGTIARQLRVHHSTVRRVLSAAGIVIDKQIERGSIIDPYRAFIDQTLRQYPDLRASRLYGMVKARGYPGALDHFRALVAGLRPRAAPEAYLRLRTLPGEQAQTDWAAFGKLTIGRAVRALMAFVMVLSYSRRIFLRFYLNAQMANFLRGHVEAFERFSAVPRVVLYDNLKSAVLERVNDAIHFHPRLLELAAHYRFQPRPVAVARGNEKGRVERAIRYVREAFFAARRFRDLDDLNAQADAWCEAEAVQRRCPEDRSRTVQAVFAEELPHLIALPANSFALDEQLSVSVRKQPYVRFDLNDYSIPHTHVGRTLSVRASLEQVRILDGPTEIASHPRSFDRAAQIEIAAHVDALVAHKQAARAHRAQDRLHHAVPNAKRLFLRAAARGAHMGSLARGLLRLLDGHGADALHSAIAAALAEDAAHLGAVRHFIDQHAHERGQAPPITLPLPERARALSVRPHPLSDYDRLNTEPTDE